MKKKIKHIWLAIIAIIIAGLAFGYAYLTTTLSINGITDIDRNSWDVYFDNVQVTDGSVSGAQEIEAPTITSDTEVEFHVNLKKPGDFYEFTIEARNDGTIDAMIETVEKKLNGVVVTTLPAYLNYIVTYEDGLEIEDNHLLAAESLETYKIRIEFKKNISSGDLPSTSQELNLSFGVSYIQSTSSATQVREEIITTEGDSPFFIGQELPNGTETYNSPEEAMLAYGHQIFLKHYASNGILISSYAGFEYNDEIYYLRGTGATFDSTNGYYNHDSIYYEANKEILYSIYGNSCIEHEILTPNQGLEYYCSKDGITASTGTHGAVSVQVDSYACVIKPEGRSECVFLDD